MQSLAGRRVNVGTNSMFSRFFTFLGLIAFCLCYTDLEVSFLSPLYTTLSVAGDIPCIKTSTFSFSCNCTAQTGSISTYLVASSTSGCVVTQHMEGRFVIDYSVLDGSFTGQVSVSNCALSTSSCDTIPIVSYGVPYQVACDGATTVTLMATEVLPSPSVSPTISPSKSRSSTISLSKSESSTCTTTQATVSSSKIPTISASALSKTASESRTVDQLESLSHSESKSGGGSNLEEYLTITLALLSVIGALTTIIGSLYTFCMCMQRNSRIKNFANRIPIVTSCYNAFNEICPSELNSSDEARDTELDIIEE